MKSDGGRAYPRPCSDVEITDRANQPRYNTPQDGMSMRQAYKLAALPAVMSQMVEAIKQGHKDPPTSSDIASRCGNIADAMIREDEEAAK